MLTQDENQKIIYFERINHRKWKWIAANMSLFACIYFVITAIINCFENGILVMKVSEMLITFLSGFILGFILAFLWFNQHKKLYKKLKEKEKQV